MGSLRKAVTLSWYGSLQLCGFFCMFLYAQLALLFCLWDRHLLFVPSSSNFQFSHMILFSIVRLRCCCYLERCVLVSLGGMPTTMFTNRFFFGSFLGSVLIRSHSREADIKLADRWRRLQLKESRF